MSVEPRVCLPTLGIVDLSSGPSGLSRYVINLFPSLSDQFRVLFFGDPGGPYTGLRPAEFIAVPESLRNNPVEGISDSNSRLDDHERANRSLSLRGLWRKAAPKSLRSVAGFVRSANTLACILKAHSVDVAYFPVCDSEFVVLAGRLAGIRSRVGTFHHLPPSACTWTRRRLINTTGRSLTSAIAVSHSAGDSWTQFLAGRGPRIQVIRNGIETPSLEEGKTRQSVLRAKFALPVDCRPVFLAAGRLVDIKGFEHLVQAARLLKGAGQSVTLAIAGEGPLRQSLETQIRQCGLEADVRLIGHVDDMDSLYRSVDGFVLSSLSEAMPYTVLEAMAYGLPVIATSVGGVPELLVEGTTGFLVPPGDSAKLAQTIQMLSLDRELRVQLGLAGRRRVTSDFCIHEMVSRTVRVFTDSASAKVRVGAIPRNCEPQRIEPSRA